jgi:DNA modification methylase
MSAPASSRSNPRSIQTVSDLTPDPQNANRGTPRGRAALTESLKTYGAGRSILADRQGRVIAGNKTLEQAQALNLPVHVVETDGHELVVVQRRDLDLVEDADARRLALADNRVAELDLEWDQPVLERLAKEMDLGALWTPAEFEQLVGHGLITGQTPEDAIVPLRPTTIQRGDLFVLGAHRLLCGDATDAADVARVLAGDQPNLLCTDPPYGVAYDAAWRVRAGRRGRHAVGPVTNDDRVDWRAAIAHFSGAIAYVWHAGLHAGAVADALASCGFELRAQIIWQKSHFVLGRGDYHWGHEPCWYAVRKGQSSSWRGDRTLSTVWSVPNLNPIGGERGGENVVTGHSTQKPVRVFEIPILAHTEPGAFVYDPFVGSGTALVAAAKTGRACCAIEIEPQYVQATIDRWEQFSGQTAQHVEAAGR